MQIKMFWLSTVWYTERNREKQRDKSKPGYLCHTQKTWATSFYTTKHKQINVHFGLSLIFNFTVFANQFFDWLVCGHVQNFFFQLLKFVQWTEETVWKKVKQHITWKDLYSLSACSTVCSCYLGHVLCYLVWIPASIISHVIGHPLSWHDEAGGSLSSLKVRD